MLTLSAARLSAESVAHNFHSMFSAVPPTLTVTNSNKTGTTDEVVYTCSGNSNSQFYYYNDVLYLWQKGYGAQVTTSTIDNLDSIAILYAPASIIAFDAQISADEGANWTNVTVEQKLGGVSCIKLPAHGSYQLRIKRKSTDFYIQEMRYYLKYCNCFRYVPE